MEQKIKNLDDIFHCSGCLLNECANMEDFKKIYEISLELAKNEDKLDWLMDWKLEEITGFCGSNNYDFSDFINVLRILKENKDYNRRTDQLMESSLIIPKRTYRYNRMEDIAKQLQLPENYINLIYCVLYKNGCLEYGSSLQCAWITTLGVEIINPNELGEEFGKLYNKRVFNEL